MIVRNLFVLQVDTGDTGDVYKPMTQTVWSMTKSLSSVGRFNGSGPVAFTVAEVY
jgi:hypothetical protein